MEQHLPLTVRTCSVNYEAKKQKNKKQLNDNLQSVTPVILSANLSAHCFCCIFEWISSLTDRNQHVRQTASADLNRGVSFPDSSSTSPRSPSTGACPSLAAPPPLPIAPPPPRGCVLSPLLLPLHRGVSFPGSSSPFTQMTVPNQSPSCQTGKVADDTAVIGIIWDGAESACWQEVDKLALWCRQHKLQLNTPQPEDMVGDFSGI